MAKTVIRCKDCVYRRAQLFGGSVTHYVENSGSVTHYVENRPVIHSDLEYRCAKAMMGCFVVSDDDGCTFGSLRDDAD